VDTCCILSKILKLNDSCLLTLDGLILLRLCEEILKISRFDSRVDRRSLPPLRELLHVSFGNRNFFSLLRFSCYSSIRNLGTMITYLSNV